MSEPRASIAERKRAVLQRMRLGALAEREGVKLSGAASSRQRRARCPFHSGNSASFAVVSKGKPEDDFGHCFGCQWHGNAIDFLAAMRGLEWIDALAALELECGIGAEGPRHTGSGPIMRERNPSRPAKREKVLVEPIDCARAIWRKAGPDLAAIRRYFTGRRVPSSVLTDARLADFRFLGLCPLGRWELTDARSRRAWPRDALVAPAVIALVREPLARDNGLLLVPVGIHVTYLNPEGSATMVRRKPWARADDVEPYFPKRKMWGPVGRGAVFLGEYHAEAALFVGEGNETVLSAMALAQAPADAVGVACLSLDNLQGLPRKWKGGILPLHALACDPARGPFLVRGHRGPVTGLVDADMAPLKGQKVVERQGGPIVERAIGTLERARICGELFVRGWRAAGVREVSFVRPRVGLDFNDVLMGEAA